MCSRMKGTTWNLGHQIRFVWHDLGSYLLPNRWCGRVHLFPALHPQQRERNGRYLPWSRAQGRLAELLRASGWTSERPAGSFQLGSRRSHNLLSHTEERERRSWSMRHNNMNMFLKWSSAHLNKKQKHTHTQPNRHTTYTDTWQTLMLTHHPMIWR